MLTHCIPLRMKSLLKAQRLLSNTGPPSQALSVDTLEEPWVFRRGKCLQYQKYQQFQQFQQYQQYQQQWQQLAPHLEPPAPAVDVLATL